MAVDISTNTDALRDLGREILKLGEEYLSDVKKVYEKVTSISESWQGDDATEYVNGVRLYEKDITELGNIVVKFGNFLVTTSGEYVNHINDLKSSAKKLFNNI